MLSFPNFPALYPHICMGLHNGKLILIIPQSIHQKKTEGYIVKTFWKNNNNMGDENSLTYNDLWW